MTEKGRKKRVKRAFWNSRVNNQSGAKVRRQKGQTDNEKTTNEDYVILAATTAFSSFFIFYLLFTSLFTLFVEKFLCKITQPQNFCNIEILWLSLTTNVSTKIKINHIEPQPRVLYEEAKFWTYRLVLGERLGMSILWAKSFGSSKKHRGFGLAPMCEFSSISYICSICAVNWIKERNCL